jgi:hypothetical protein
MSHHIHNVAIGAVLALGAMTASAEPATPHRVLLPTVNIVGRIQKPIAAVDVGRIEPKFTLAEPKSPFLDRIERVVSRSPY